MVDGKRTGIAGGGAGGVGGVDKFQSVSHALFDMIELRLEDPVLCLL